MLKKKIVSRSIINKVIKENWVFCVWFLNDIFTQMLVVLQNIYF